MPGEIREAIGRNNTILKYPEPPHTHSLNSVMNKDRTLKNCEIQGTWWQFLTEPHPYEFSLLVIAGIVLEIVVHYYLGISVVYTHFYYIIIVIAGLWYGRKAIWIALFFGGLHVVVTDYITGAISPDALVRAVTFCIVAFVVGTVAEQLRCYHSQLLQQNLNLQELNNNLITTNQKLELSRISFETANRKLNLLSGITRHDIRNQLTGLLGYLELIREQSHDPEILLLVEKEEQAAQNIVRQIEFTKNYEDLGVSAPLWQDVALSVNALKSSRSLGQVTITTKLKGLEIYADPLFEKVHENLIDNSIRHGERVKHITFTWLPYANNAIALVYEDDGIGVHEEDKERIFEKGFGKHTGLGLFLTREILAITGITIKESGTYGKGVRFEILIPQGKYRFPEH
jgi:signal transduction histidine kinase